MKRWIFILIILAVSVAFVVYLFERGHLANMKWENIAIVLAAVFAPLSMAFNWLKGFEDDSQAKESLQYENEKLKADLAASQKLNDKIRQSEQEAARIEREIELINANLSMMNKPKL